ncbi:MAG: TraM recognition domain-containing protein [Pseudomonadota bacterium]
MSLPTGSIFGRLTGRFRTIDPDGQRLLGYSLTSGEPIFAPIGHSLILAAAGSGKTTRGAMVWLFSLLSTAGSAATLVLDSKSGEICAQLAPLLAELGIPFGIIDDMDVWPPLAPWRVQLNAFGSAIAVCQNNPQDLVYVIETITLSLIPEPKDGDDKNKYWRAWARKLIAFALGVLLKRNVQTATPGGVAAMLDDPDMLQSMARIEAEEGDGSLRAAGQAIVDMVGHEHWPQHLEEAQRAMRIYGPETRLHQAGRNATTTHAELIRQGAVIFLVGPQERLDKLGSYYASHMNSFGDALFQDAGELRVVGDEITNAPVKELLVDRITTIRAFGGQIFAIGQSRSEFVRKFGEQETRTIEDNAIVKQYLGFSSFEEAERVSKAIGEEFAVSAGLSGEVSGLKSQESLGLSKQRLLTPAQLMAMPPTRQLLHIKGVGFFMAGTYAQNEIAPYCHRIAANPLEGGRLPPNPKIRLALPKIKSKWSWR